MVNRIQVNHLVDRMVQVDLITVLKEDLIIKDSLNNLITKTVDLPNKTTTKGNHTKMLKIRDHKRYLITMDKRNSSLVKSNKRILRAPPIKFYSKRFIVTSMISMLIEIASKFL